MFIESLPPRYRRGCAAQLRNQSTSVPQRDCCENMHLQILHNMLRIKNTMKKRIETAISSYFIRKNMAPVATVNHRLL